MSFTDLDKSLSTPPLSPNSKEGYLQFHHNSSQAKRSQSSDPSGQKRRPRAPPPPTSPGVRLPPGLSVTRGSSRDSIGLRHHFAQHPPSPNFTRLQAIQAQQQRQSAPFQGNRGSSAVDNKRGGGGVGAKPTEAFDSGVGSSQGVHRKVRDDTPRPTLHGLSSSPMEVQHAGSGRPLVVSPPSSVSSNSPTTYFDQFHRHQQKFYSQTPSPMTRVIANNAGVLGGNTRGGGGGIMTGEGRDSHFSSRSGDPGDGRGTAMGPGRRSALSPTATPGVPQPFSPEVIPVASKWRTGESMSSSPSSSSSPPSFSPSNIYGGLATPISLNFLSSFSPLHYYNNYFYGTSSSGGGSDHTDTTNNHHGGGPYSTVNMEESLPSPLSYNDNQDRYEDGYEDDGDAQSTSTPLSTIQSGNGGGQKTEQQQYDYEARQLSQQVFNISSNIAVLERLIPCLGQRHKDTVELRESLHSVLNQTRDLVKSANVQVKHLARFHLPQAVQPTLPVNASSSSPPPSAVTTPPFSGLSSTHTYGSIGDEAQPLLPIRPTSSSSPALSASLSNTSYQHQNNSIALDTVERGLLRKPTVQYSDLTPAQRQIVTARRLTHQRLTKDLTVVTRAFQELQRNAIVAERQQVAQLRRLSSTCASLRHQSAAQSMYEVSSDEDNDRRERLYHGPDHDHNEDDSEEEDRRIAMRSQGIPIDDVPIVQLDFDLKVVPPPPTSPTTNTSMGPLHSPGAGLPPPSGSPQAKAGDPSTPHRSPRHPQLYYPRGTSNHPQQSQQQPSQKRQKQQPPTSTPSRPTHPHDRQLSIQEQAHLAELQWMDNELELQQAILNEREDEILKIEQGMAQVLQVMQELGAMVHEQRSGVDMLQDSIGQAMHHTDQAYQELVQASHYDRRRRDRMCYLVLVSSLVATVVLLALTS